MRSGKRNGQKPGHRSRAKLQKVEIKRSRRTPARKRKLGDAQLVLGDALIEIQRLPEQSVDLIVSSPPYNIGKQYERNSKLSFDDYIAWQDSIIEALIKRLKPSGSICWQVGSYINDGESFPLDIYFYDSFKKRGLQRSSRPPRSLATALNRLQSFKETTPFSKHGATIEKIISKPKKTNDCSKNTLIFALQRSTSSLTP